MCCLDVYVHSTAQRQGVGAALFRLVCTAMGLDHPGRFAFDKPSAKMKPFLAKHFGLKGQDEQPNRFLVFDCFWGGPAPGPLYASECSGPLPPAAASASGSSSAPEQDTSACTAATPFSQVG